MERIDRKSRERIRRALEGLVVVRPRRNLDVRPLTGHASWLRLRVGNTRVIFRPIEVVYLVERVIDRRDLDEALRAL